MTTIVSTLIKGGYVMVPLLVCSVIALAVILERAWFWWHASSDADADRALALAGSGEWDGAVEAGLRSPSPVARVLAAGISDRNPSATLAMEAAAQAELGRMKRGLPVHRAVLAGLEGLDQTVKLPAHFDAFLARVAAADARAAAADHAVFVGGRPLAEAAF